MTSSKPQNLTEYFSIQERLMAAPDVALMYYLMLLCGVIAIVANGTVAVCMLACVRTLKPSLLLIISLAAGDVMNGVCSVYHFSVTYAELLPRNQESCLVRVSLQVLAFRVVSVEMFDISLDRWVQCVAPLKYKTFVTRKVILGFLTVNWTTALMIAIAGPVLRKLKDDREMGEALVTYFYTRYRCVAPRWNTAVLVTLSVFVMLPIAMATLLYVYIYVFVMYRKQINHSDQNRNRKAFVSILFITATFSVTYLPILWFAIALGSGWATPSWLANQRFCIFGYLLPVVGSALNPVIYVYRYPDARKCIQKILGGRLFAWRCFGRSIRVEPSVQVPVSYKKESQLALFNDVTSGANDNQPSTSRSVLPEEFQ